MPIRNSYYPVALILIIVFAGYLLYGNYIKPTQVDYARYQSLCRDYLRAAEGCYPREQMQMLVHEIEYLLPGPANEQTPPADRELMECAAALTERLNKGK